MFVLVDKNGFSEKQRQRLISQLEIPTFECGQKLMFYDVLQKLVFRAFKIQHNKRKARENMMKLKVINIWLGKG